MAENEILLNKLDKNISECRSYIEILSNSIHDREKSCIYRMKAREEYDDACQSFYSLKRYNLENKQKIDETVELYENELKSLESIFNDLKKQENPNLENTNRKILFGFSNDYNFTRNDTNKNNNHPKINKLSKFIHQMNDQVSLSQISQLELLKSSDIVTSTKTQFQSITDTTKNTKKAVDRYERKKIIDSLIIASLVIILIAILIYMILKRL
ncbi:hypothetical protein MXB_5173 [Myxobolus squamalis]|nr:hypothetical protein MXB_5173 [Myxobolus squamalis]